MPVLEPMLRPYQVDPARRGSVLGESVVIRTMGGNRNLCSGCRSMIGTPLLFTCLLLGSQGYKIVDKLSLSPGKEIQIHSTSDTIVSKDFSLVIKIGETPVSIESEIVTIGQYQIQRNNISAWVFLRYESDQIMLTGIHDNGKGGTQYFPVGIPINSIDKVAIPMTSSPKVPAPKLRMNEKWVMAGVLIGGGSLVGAVAGTIYAAKNDNGYQGQGIGGMVAGMGLGFLMGSLLYLQFTYEF